MIGPNDSSLAMNMSSVTSVKMVGYMKKPITAAILLDSLTIKGRLNYLITIFCSRDFVFYLLMGTVPQITNRQSNSDIHGT